LVRTRLGSPRHVGDLEVLVDDEVVIVDQPTGQLVGEVPASVGDLAIVGGHPHVWTGCNAEWDSN
jgi:hypothetical protein